ncbi:bifunctional methylenetetrahydrofolate dehydrogenase/methenyltetrahydrofolate cyclohydrolase FolD [Anaeromyxobacter oryzisoli]|uniref:bifunctional methylenetetrahydrofolate dehydrogenase/methenyltetrahydrofolate cyclohydrolase FolD n=1 Tax=Anaeromyxobacter oryzisoli TaxID=2925408 RepID=UPI001F5AF6EE|nr:bifunctional methylenetetrahydrofolate dehydrogenase/methenyltetrahydrofolate cyclohydrolase FolD [Anaeromyxobacter sp. SG63]
MSMIIDGKQIAAKVKAEVAEAVKALKAKGVHTGLTVVRVGEDPASAIYVRGKRKDCEEVGIRSEEHHLPATVTQADLLALIGKLNADPSVHGILVQLPLPKHVDERAILDAILPAKDADGFHPFNVGALSIGIPGVPRPCTPAGVMRMLEEAKVDPKGKRALVVGRSNIVGKPMAMMLLEKHATVTVAHSRTQDLAGEVARADILVAAIGKAEFVKGDWIREGAVVIDVGMNRLPDGKLVGDVEYAAAARRASAITPVPGGVGPMTRAMLLVNTVELARRTLG